MPFIGKSVPKYRQDNPFRYDPSTDLRDIVILAGTKFPTGVSGEDDYVIPLGTPMCPVTAGTGAYKPWRTATIVTAATASELLLNVGASKAKGFDVGDVVNVMQLNSTVALATVSTVGTVDTINYTTGVITLTNSLGLVVSANCVIEVAQNGAATLSKDAVILLENVKTRDTDLGQNVTVHSVGARQFQVEIGRMNVNSWNSIAGRLFPDADIIPATPGV